MVCGNFNSSKLFCNSDEIDWTAFSRWLCSVIASLFNSLFNKFVIFDILVNAGDYLIGKTFEQRIKLLDEMFGQNECEKDYLFGISDNVYRVKSYENNFNMLFDKLTPIDLIEGLVLKRKNARLEMGNTELNNTKSQIKARKPTLNYKF